jgi:LSD1 subclass zinc finger protein
MGENNKIVCSSLRKNYKKGAREIFLSSCATIFFVRRNW